MLQCWGVSAPQSLCLVQFSLLRCKQEAWQQHSPEFFHIQLSPVLALLLGAHPWELLGKPVARRERPLRQRVTVVPLQRGGLTVSVVATCPVL